MLIIPPAPMKFDPHTSLAANTVAWDSFVIRPLESNFQLSLYKVVDSQNNRLSEKYYPIAILETYEQCEQLFQDIVEAMENGDRVFRVRDYLEKNALQRDDLPKV